MAGIVNFFKEKKMDMKFSKAGEGHKLNEEKKPIQPQNVVIEERKPQSCAAMVAGAAAIERTQNKEKRDTVVKPKLAMSKSSMKSTDHQNLSFPGASHRITSDGGSSFNSQFRPITTAAVEDQQTVPVEISTPFERVQVLMVCPVCKRSLPHASVKSHVQQCLHEEYLKEPITASVQMIYTLAETEEKKTTCVNTIIRYIDNILSHPGEEKYRKIRASNKAYKERVDSVTGGTLFLEAIGFVQQTLSHEAGQELFFVLPEAKALCSDDLMAWKEMLTCAERLVPVLDRNPQLMVPRGNIERYDLSDEFYNVSVEEIKKEQRLRSEAVEQASVLRTKAMREKDEVKVAVKYYRFILLRLRFPEDVILQGVFKPMESLSEVRQFVSSCLLEPSRQYRLSFMRNQLIDDTSRLAQLGLAPAAVLSLQWEGGEEWHGFPIEQIFKPEVYKTLDP